MSVQVKINAAATRHILLIADVCINTLLMKQFFKVLDQLYDHVETFWHHMINSAAFLTGHYSSSRAQLKSLVLLLHKV